MAMLCASLLSGCMSPGEPSARFVDAKVMDAYIPLYARENFIQRKWAAAVNIAPHIAVTNDHNLGLIPEESLIGRSRDYDLLFFRTDSEAVIPIAKPTVGERVIAYGQGGEESRREAEGVVRELDSIVKARCEDCKVQRSIMFEAPGGMGFSGGPVVDARSGALVGITFGFQYGMGEDSPRRMFAFDMDLVMTEMRRLVAAVP